MSNNYANSIESEIILQVKDYIEHCKKYDAQCTINECIEFIAENLYQDYEEIENAFGSLIIDMLHIFMAKNEATKVKYAKHLLENNGYKVI